MAIEGKPAGAARLLSADDGGLAQPGRILSCGLHDAGQGTVCLTSARLALVTGAGLQQTKTVARLGGHVGDRDGPGVVAWHLSVAQCRAGNATGNATGNAGVALAHAAVGHQQLHDHLATIRRSGSELSLAWRAADVLGRAGVFTLPAPDWHVDARLPAVRAWSNVRIEFFVPSPLPRGPGPIAS